MKKIGHVYMAAFVVHHSRGFAVDSLALLNPAWHERRGALAWRLVLTTIHF